MKIYEFTECATFDLEGIHPDESSHFYFGSLIVEEDDGEEGTYKEIAIKAFHTLSKKFDPSGYYHEYKLTLTFSFYSSLDNKPFTKVCFVKGDRWGGIESCEVKYCE